MDRRALLLILASAGCRQIFGLDDLPDKLIDARTTVDVPNVIDTLPPADCMTRWRTTPVFGSPVALTTLNTAGDEDHPFLSPDEKTIYFSRDADIYAATRATTLDPFGLGVLDSSLSTQLSTEGKVFVNFDGTRAFFSSDQAGTAGGFDLWRGARNTNSGPFNVDRMYVGSLDDDKSQLDPHMSSDLLHLYFIPAAGGSQHIALATRANTNQDFGNPTSLIELAAPGAGAEAGPTLTEDETVIVFSSTRTGREQLYYAVRMTSTGMFAVPKLVPDVGSTASTELDAAPHVSRDGCRVYFTSTRNGSRDLFVATML